MYKRAFANLPVFNRAKPLSRLKANKFGSLDLVALWDHIDIHDFDPKVLVKLLLQRKHFGHNGISVRALSVEVVATFHIKGPHQSS